MKADPDCPICGKKPSLTELSDYEAFCNGQPEPEPEEEGRAKDDERGGCGRAHQLSVVDAHQMLSSENPPFLLDVRTPGEVQIASIPNAHVIPLQEIPYRYEEINSEKDGPMIIHCHHGMRSMQAAMFLQTKGFSKLYNLTGGIDAWSQSIDPSIARY